MFSPASQQLRIYNRGKEETAWTESVRSLLGDCSIWQLNIFMFGSSLSWVKSSLQFKLFNKCILGELVLPEVVCKCVTDKHWHLLLCYWPVGLSLGGCARVPVVLVVLKQDRGEGGGEALPAVIVQTTISLHQPSHKEDSSSDLLLHGYTPTDSLQPLGQWIQLGSANSNLYC